MKNRELATKIYQALKDKGAGIGNASIGIIDKVLSEYDISSKPIHYPEPKDKKEYWQANYSEMTDWEDYNNNYFWCGRCGEYVEGQCTCYSR